ncbi:nucleoside phosphorylase-I family protein [Helicobacter cetorum]|uniref:Purine nucleoside phosphorylase n=1 Tax=Helicobacter cetorum (strain ATCC BAA-540 / CCUG 52418 / MIT 99-5656) TaxID=1163745 RepID=I0ESL0_HELCM|nr:purine-nucleoside phosphorylase [Helicobacter cetorum]AFI05929.1 purine nucleoside phosphorylase [Helicobacter cetorum MIT 99-5656]
MLLCAGRNEMLKGAMPIGVGLVESAINLTSICLKNPSIESLIFIGSAGSYSQEIELLSVFESVECYQIEESFSNLKSYTPLDNFIKVEYEEKALLKRVKLNSSNYIHTNEIFAKKMAQNGILLENMEFFSVLSVAKTFSLRAKGIFCVSNYVGTNAHKEFKENHAEVKRILENTLKG